MHKFLKMHILLKEFVFPFGKTDRHGDLSSHFIVGKKEKMLVRNQKQSFEKVSFEDQDWKFHTMSFAKYISKQFGKDSDNKRASENKSGCIYKYC